MNLGTDPSAEVRFQGTPVSPGIAIGPVHVSVRGMSAPETHSITPEEVHSEKERFQRALNLTRQQIQEVRDRIGKISGESEGKIFDAHLLFLEDNTLLRRVEKELENRLQNVDSVFYAIIQNYLEAMRRVQDPYLRERTADIEDVSLRVLNCLERREIKDTAPDHQHVLVAFDLTPSDTALMDPDQVLGFCTEMGSTNSHTAILARSLGIPAIVGLERALIEVKMKQTCIIDGYRGELILNPTPETLKKYKSLRRQKDKAYQSLDSVRDLNTQTSDGHEIVLSANIEFIHELKGLKTSGAQGIGLYRTEFFLLEDEEMPDETRQTQVYSEFIEACSGHQAIIRTLDSGGDKLSAEPFSEPEPNPFLGWRGIRVSLSRPDLFKTQLRAILKVSARGKTGVMFPMISGISELRAAKAILEECKLELDRAKVPFDPDIEVGMMIEVPSAAILADVLAPEVDFFSIGTNDLTQYTVAVDRVNHRVADLFRSTNPAVIRLIKNTIKAGQDHGIWTGICGEIASDIRLSPLLVGLGTSELSVGVHQIPIIKSAIRSLNFADCENLAEECLKMHKSGDILAATRNMAKTAYPDLFFET